MQEHLAKVRGAFENSTAFYRKYTDDVNAELRKVEQDKTLSAHGKFEKKSQLKKKYAELFLKTSADFKKEIKKELEQARNKAEKVVYAQIKKPDDETVERYRKQLNELKVQVTLATNPHSAKMKVSEFSNSVQDPYLSEMLRDSYGDLIAPIISKAGVREAGLLQMELQETFDGLKTRFKSQEVLDAESVIESVQALENSRLFNLAVLQHANGFFGRQIAEAINEPEAYFAKLEEEKQAQ